MITIITGVPGMGKTAQLVHMLLKNDKLGFNARPVFVMGVNGLLLDHAKCPPVSEWTEQRPDPDDPTLFLDYFTFPPNSILVIDEAQRVYRNRARTSKVPPHVAALETHRHTGIDVILLTQKPKQMDDHVLGLAGRHLHIKNTILGRKLFEWGEFKNVDSISNLDVAIKRSYKPPKEVFNLYKSAEVHTKQPSGFHQIFIYLGIAVVLLGYLGNKIYSRIDSKLNPETENTLDITNNETINDVINGSLPDSNKSIPISTEPLEYTHPFKNFTFYIVGSINNNRTSVTYYRLVSSTSEFEISSTDLERAGYSINYLNDCSNFMFFNGATVTATCNYKSTQTASKPLNGIIKGATLNAKQTISKH